MEIEFPFGYLYESTGVRQSVSLNGIGEELVMSNLMMVQPHMPCVVGSKLCINNNLYYLHIILALH